MELRFSQKCYIKSQNRDKNNTPEAVCKTMHSRHTDFNIWFSLKGTYCDRLSLSKKLGKGILLSFRSFKNVFNVCKNCTSKLIAC